MNRGWLVFVLLLCGSACSSSDTIVLGSKNFTEQVILGELMAQQIEKETNLKVDRLLNLGGTFICDRALRSGEIDGYVEYTGTAFTAILKNRPITDPQEVYRRVKQSYEQESIEWLKPLGFNNTYVIIIRKEEARRLGIRTISEVAVSTPGWVGGFGYEFIERADGFKGLSQVYNLEFAEPPKVMELGLMYRALAEKEVDLIAGDATNGLIDALGLFALEDDRNYFPPYDAVPVFRSETLTRYPTLRYALDALGGAISAEEMRHMNHQVDGERRTVKEVVFEFMERKGLGRPR